MLKSTALITFLLFAGLAFAQESSDKKTLRLASTNWCPYICEEQQSSGFIVNYMRALLATKNIELEVTVLPWSRAINMAQQGRLDGLLTAVESEAEGFKLTNEPTGSYQICLYSRLDDSISYTDRASLQNITLGGVKEYGYGEPIDSVLRSPEAGESSELVSSDKPLDQLIRMLEARRIDLFAEDKHVVDHFLTTHPEQEPPRLAGCLKEVPFYTAISPKTENSEQWIELLNGLLKSDGAEKMYIKARTEFLKLHKNSKYLILPASDGSSILQVAATGK